MDKILSTPDIPSKSDKPKSSFGLYTTIAIGGVALGFSIIAIPFVTPALRKHTLPYVPATDKQIENVFKTINLIKKTSNKQRLSLIDLGSGDGRIVFEASKRGFEATGVEINFFLYLYSRFKAFSFNTNPRPMFKRANLWNVNLGNYDLIVLFGVQEMMKDLSVKLNKEIKPDTTIITCRFPIHDYKEIYSLEDGVDSVWVYDKNALNEKFKK
jgi:hypothetical protein